MSDKEATQSIQSVRKNAAYFKDNFETYNQYVQTLDTYASLRHDINQAIQGIGHLLDIGNGGVFDYDTNQVEKITAMDLFLEDLGPDYVCPQNVVLKQGDALAIADADNSYDGVLMVMLIHHLIGKTVDESIQNMQKAIKEAYRVVKPGGKLIIAESCVPSWFYVFEKMVFPLAVKVIDKIIDHPAVIQYPVSFIKNVMEKESGNQVMVHDVNMGKWVMQFGFKVPTFLTP